MFSISKGRAPIPIHHRAAYRAAVLPAHIPGVALHGVDPAVLHLFHDAHMVGEAIPFPVEEDDVPGAGLVAAVLPEPPGFEPVGALDAPGKPGDHPHLQVAALLRAPAHKAGAPVHPAAEPVPAPVGLAADVPHLGEGHRNDLPVPSGDAVEHLGP